MNQEYDLFEKFQDGSSIWRDSIPGFGKTRLRLQELARTSNNLFYAIDLETGEVLALNPECDSHAFRAPSKTENRSKTHSC
jgi:hypothetical protein